MSSFLISLIVLIGIICIVGIVVKQTNVQQYIPGWVIQILWVVGIVLVALWAISSFSGYITWPTFSR